MRLEAHHTLTLEIQKGPCCNSRSSPTYPSPLERKHEGPAHIQRNPVSASQLEMRDPILLSQERFFSVPVASQEQGLSIGKARGTPGSCHHSKSPPDISVHFRGTCFPRNASTFTPRIHSHHGGTWDSPVGKPRGKATDPLIPAKGSVTHLLHCP